MAKIKIKDNVTGKVIEIDDSEIGKYGLKPITATPSPIAPKAQVAQQKQPPIVKAILEGNLASKNLVGGNNIGSDIINSLLKPFVNLAQSVPDIANKQNAFAKTQPNAKGNLPQALKNALGMTGNLAKNTILSPDVLKNEVAAAATLTNPVSNSWKGTLGKGAIVGGGQSLPDARNAQDVGVGALGGAAGNALLGKVLPGVFGAGKKIVNAGRQRIADEAAQGISKASPSVWKKAVQEHGIDPNALTKKYVPKGSNYDDLLGVAQERGEGGVLSGKLKSAEAVIQDVVAKNRKQTIDGSEIITALKKEESTLRNKLGGGRKADDLANIIKEAEKKYGKGLTLDRAVTTMRDANKQFGKSIVDDSGGAVITDSQKIEANILKKIVKKMFPDIADGLKTQEEILTLRPILEHARAVNNTPGSEIRKGLLSNIDLTKPGSLIETPVDAIMRNPKLASILLNAGPKAQAGGQTNRIIQQILGQAGARGGAALTTMPQNETQNAEANNSTYDNSQSPSIQNEVNQSDTSITQDVNTPVAEEPILDESGQWRFDEKLDDWVPNDQTETQGAGGLTRAKIQQLMIEDLAVGGKNIPELKTIMDTLPEDEEEAKLELSDGAIKNINDLKGAIADTENLTGSIGGSDVVGPVSGYRALNPYDTEAKSLQAEIDRVRQVVGKALEGGVLRKEDEEKYKKILPTARDTREVAANKLQKLKEKLNLDLATYIELQRSYGKGKGIENILPSQ